RPEFALAPGQACKSYLIERASMRNYLRRNV
ncbi:unnamed protein product, partial [marine sediment metagenome]